MVMGKGHNPPTPSSTPQPAQYPTWLLTETQRFDPEPDPEPGGEIPAGVHMLGIQQRVSEW